MTTLKEFTKLMDDKKILLELSLPIIKKIYGDNFTSKEITDLSIEIMEDVTGVSFSNNFTFTYIGTDRDVRFNVDVHYDDTDSPAYEVIEDVIHKHDDGEEVTESNIVCFGSIKSVIDMFVTNTAYYVK